MPQSYLIFDFGANEETAQQARHRLEGWKQAFRLGEKVRLKFERQMPETAPEQSTKKAKRKGSDEKAQPDGSGRIRMIILLDFSDHERLSHHRWLERIPTEEPFKSAQKQVIRYGDAAFDSTAELFTNLK